MDETAQKKPVAVDSIAKPATDSLQAEPTDSLQAEPTDSLATDALKAQTDKDSTAVKQQPTAVEKPAVRQPEPDYLKYDAMDERVRTGAYYIMGTDTVLTVKEGETLYRISKRTLGTDMMCYIEVYNGVTPATLKTGQKLKIPKLELKKLVRKRMEKKQ
jgi:LysM repeat protein